MWYSIIYTQDRTIRKVRNWNQKWVLIAGTPCIRRIWFHGFIISMKIQNQQQFSWLVWTRGNIITVTHLRLPILNYLAQFKFKTKVRSWITYAILWMDFSGISETDLLYITLIKSRQILKFCITIQLKKVNRFEHDIIKSLFFHYWKANMYHGTFIHF